VHTSNYEGFGLPLLEALSYCCPVIASKNSSVPEVLKDAGIYFRPDDINDLSKKLNQYLYASSYEQTKIIEKGIEVNKQFSWKKTANQTLEIYKGLLKNEK
jgi:glycosyltransferase involved in cell wall biosynthesis